MTNAQSTAYRFRFAVLAIALACWAVGLYLLFGGVTTQDPHDANGLTGLFAYDIEGWAPVAIYLGIFLITQWLFLMPRGNWRIRLNEQGRPMKLSVVIAALMAAAVSTGLIAALLEIPGWWKPMLYTEGPHEADRRWIGLVILGGLWVAWAIIFFIYWRGGDRYTQFTRMIRGLIGGSVIELIVCVPVHISVLNQKDDCYCVRGSYTGLILGGTVLCWAFGPGVILLFMREHVRRAKLLANESADQSTAH